jgi:hypothetical protein
MSTMASSVRVTKARAPLGRRRTSSERRTKGRLRDLCDEVLASYRLAIGEDLVTDEDRDTAQQQLKTFVPRLA